MRYILIGVLALLGACANQTAQQSKRETIPLTEEHLATVQVESEIGGEIYRKDGYAAKATDYLFERGVLPNDPRVTGWVVDLQKEVPVVYFMGPGENELRSFHSVWFTAKGPRYAAKPDISAVHESMFRARMLGLENIQLKCSDRYNTVVIDGGENWLVYVLAATTDPNIIMAGGHHRITVSKDNHAVLEVKPLSRSCLELPNDPEGLPFLTHIVDPTPIAIHSFLSLLHHKTVYVGTETGLWKVEDGVISPAE